MKEQLAGFEYLEPLLWPPTSHVYGLWRLDTVVNSPPAQWQDPYSHCFWLILWEASVARAVISEISYSHGWLSTSDSGVYLAVQSSSFSVRPCTYFSLCKWPVNQSHCLWLELFTILLLYSAEEVTVRKGNKPVFTTSSSFQRCVFFTVTFQILCHFKIKH